MVVHSLCFPSIGQGLSTSLRSHASSLGPQLKFLLLESYARSDMGTSVVTLALPSPMITQAELLLVWESGP